MRTDIMSLISLCMSIYVVATQKQAPAPVAAEPPAAVSTNTVNVPPTEPVAVFDYGDTPVPDQPTFASSPETVATVPPVVTDDVAKDVVTPTTESSAFADVPPPEPVKQVAAVNPEAAVQQLLQSTTPATDAWLDNVMQVRCQDWSGTAVAISPDTLFTVHHIVGSGNATVTDKTGKVWNAVVTYPAGANDYDKDGAVLKVKGANFPWLKTRTPKYYEPVTVYGLRTQTKQRGLFSGARLVSLVPGQVGIKQGDSGGAVIADDGCLVGLVSGNENALFTAPANTLAVTVLRMDYMAPYVPAKPDDSVRATVDTGKTEAAPSQAVTPAKQPSAFDPPAVQPVKPAASTQTCTVPQQSYQQPVRYYYNTGQQYRTRRWVR